MHWSHRHTNTHTNTYIVLQIKFTTPTLAAAPVGFLAPACMQIRSCMHTHTSISVWVHQQILCACVYVCAGCFVANFGCCLAPPKKTHTHQHLRTHLFLLLLILLPLWAACLVFQATTMLSKIVTDGPLCADFCLLPTTRRFATLINCLSLQVTWFCTYI